MALKHYNVRDHVIIQLHHVAATLSKIQISGAIIIHKHHKVYCLIGKHSFFHQWLPSASLNGTVGLVETPTPILPSATK
ncbi:hypothetical protein [Pedobacter rhodius]|uniref:Uncharacterized protein n=1 Tax=Pedobacter rhodius TaxID=3004098 RepID=A0ABT4KX30_9SPHI|nr:hypothetical protein [Pedobacter sp. SJ11]MCZ4223459.1 hypothetical protein [Pedobacter sp. SJ11]